MSNSSNAPSKPVLAGLALLGLLVLASLWLGFERIFQVDEVQYAATARFMATGRTTTLAASVPFILLGPLTWLAGTAHDSVQVLTRLRIPFVALMWVNAILLVKGAGFRLRSRPGLAALLLASTLAPLWDYGFEIRHDVVLVTATLGLWCLLRETPSRSRLFLAGVLGALTQFIAFKGFMYAVPLLALGLLLSRPRGGRAFLKHLGLVLAGLAAGFLLGRILHGLAGTWPLAWSAFRANSSLAAGKVERFEPWTTLARIFVQAPLLACGSLVALTLPFLSPRVDRPGTLVTAPWFPEWCFAFLCLALFLVNPTPYAYNLLHLVPALAILLLRLREPFLLGLASMAPPARTILAATLVLLHGLPWAANTWRHVSMDNDRQCEVIRLAEAMTDPGHRVFDGSGLVSCRDPLGSHWLIHTFTIQHFSDGTWPTVRTLLAANPTPVILPNYRVYWLPREDHAFIRAHYYVLADDFLVLGGLLEAGSPPFEALAEGRYQIDLEGGPGAEAPVFSMDGQSLQPGIQVLTRGPHAFQVPPGRRLRVAWVGPRLKALPALNPAPHPLFVNWY